MIPSKLITKENAKKRLEDRGEDFMAIFVSGSDLHPNPKMYKYNWWIYSMESEEKSAAEVFYTKAYRLTTKEFEVGLIAKGTCPRKYIPVQSGEIGVTLLIDGVEIQNGDYVYVDPDGIVICKEKLV